MKNSKEQKSPCIKVYDIFCMVHCKVWNSFRVFQIICYYSLSQYLVIYDPFDSVIIHVNLNYNLRGPFRSWCSDSPPNCIGYINVPRVHDFTINKMVWNSFIWHFALLYFWGHINNSNFYVVMKWENNFHTKFELSFSWKNLIEQ